MKKERRIVKMRVVEGIQRKQRQWRKAKNDDREDVTAKKGTKDKREGIRMRQRVKKRTGEGRKHKKEGRRQAEEEKEGFAWRVLDILAAGGGEEEAAITLCL